jgi:hypothetical protein
VNFELIVVDGLAVFLGSVSGYLLLGQLGAIRLQQPIQSCEREVADTSRHSKLNPIGKHADVVTSGHLQRHR